MKTSSIRKHEPSWHLVDVQDQIVGRVCTSIATLLRGKGKVSFVNYLDCGDHVVVINAGKLTMTGKKLEHKEYYHYSGFMGGLKTKFAKNLIKENPEQIIISAVKGMLPKNKLQNEWMKRLHVYPGPEHPHQANVAQRNK